MSDDEPNGGTVEGQDRSDEGSDSQDRVAHIHSLSATPGQIGHKKTRPTPDKDGSFTDKIAVGGFLARPGGCTGTGDVHSILGPAFLVRVSLHPKI